MTRHGNWYGNLKGRKSWAEVLDAPHILDLEYTIKAFPYWGYGEWCDGGKRQIILNMNIDGVTSDHMAEWETVYILRKFALWLEVQLKDIEAKAAALKIPEDDR